MQRQQSYGRSASLRPGMLSLPNLNRIDSEQSLDLGGAHEDRPDWFTEHVALSPDNTSALSHCGAPEPQRVLNAKTPEDLRRREGAAEHISRISSRYLRELDMQKQRSDELKMPHSTSMPNLLDSVEYSSNEARLGGSRHATPLLNQRPSKRQPSEEACCCAGIASALFGRSTPSTGVSAPAYDSRDSAVIFFDWDDTLLPTTFIIGTVFADLKRSDDSDALPYVPKDSPHYGVLEKHANVVAFVLRAARKVARVAIVTLSMNPWVEASAARYLPGLNISELLRELEIPVYYSRGHVETIPVQFHDERSDIIIDHTSGKLGIAIDPQVDDTLALTLISKGGLFSKWNTDNPTNQVMAGDRIAEVNGRKDNLVEACRKKEVLNIGMLRSVATPNPHTEAKRIDMSTALEQYYAGKLDWQRNVISIGDSCAEQEALKEVLSQWTDAPCKAESAREARHLCKTVNLLDKPSPEQLANELRILLVWLPHMVEYCKSFDLTMDKLDHLEQELFRTSAS